MVWLGRAREINNEAISVVRLELGVSVKHNPKGGFDVSKTIVSRTFVIYSSDQERSDGEEECADPRPKRKTGPLRK